MNSVWSGSAVVSAQRDGISALQGGEWRPHTRGHVCISNGSRAVTTTFFPLCLSLTRPKNTSVWQNTDLPIRASVAGRVLGSSRSVFWCLSARAGAARRWRLKANTLQMTLASRFSLFIYLFIYSHALALSTSKPLFVFFPTLVRSLIQPAPMPIYCLFSQFL